MCSLLGTKMGIARKRNTASHVDLLKKEDTGSRGRITACLPNHLYHPYLDMLEVVGYFKVLTIVNKVIWIFKKASLEWTAYLKGPRGQEFDLIDLFSIFLPCPLWPTGFPSQHTQS